MIVGGLVQVAGLSDDEVALLLNFYGHPDEVVSDDIAALVARLKV